MMRRWPPMAAALLALAGCGGERPGAANAGPGAVVADSAVACLRIGASAAEVRRACGAVQDTTIPLEGMAQEALWVTVWEGRALAEMVDGAVWRIRVRDPALATRDAIAVGTPVRTLAGLPGMRVAHGEGTFVLTDAHCGKSFQVEGLPDRPEPWAAAEMAALPDSVRVAEILVLGRCR
ncbi:MAG TPA: hypothetical protein VLA43_08815 [Longimicrobiales bacterium]|nr:hypothetical protein [Longimicrobiales bacterium]